MRGTLFYMVDAVLCWPFIAAGFLYTMAYLSFLKGQELYGVAIEAALRDVQRARAKDKQ